MRPGRSLKRSVLESKNKEVTENGSDLEENEKLNSSKATAKRQIDEKPIFKLVLPPDLAKELDSSDDMVTISSSHFTRSTKKKSTRKTKNSTKKPTVKILSSSGEDGEDGEEDLADGYPSSSTKEVGHPSVEDNGKSSFEENNSLVSSKKLSQGNNLSTSKRNKYQMKQKLIQSKKENEMDSENSGDDPFGFGKAERRVREKKVIQNLFSSDNSQKLKDSQYDSNVQSETIQNISLDEEKNKNDIDSSEFDKQDRTQMKQENNEHYSSSEIEKDDDSDNGQNIQDEGHISTEIDKRSAEFSELTPLKDKNKTVEKKNNRPSKVQKDLNITKTVDLVSLLPLRRAPKKKIDNRFYDYEDDENELSLDEEKRYSDYEEKKSPMKRKIQSKKGEKKSRKIKKETLSWESNELDEKPKHERAERARRTYEIDNFELSEEVV